MDNYFKHGDEEIANIEKRAAKKVDYPGDKGGEFIENKEFISNLDMYDSAPQVAEINMYVNSESYPESQMHELDKIDTKIKELEIKIEKLNLSDYDLLSDYRKQVEGLSLEKELIKKECKKNDLIRGN